MWTQTTVFLRSLQFSCVVGSRRGPPTPPRFKKGSRQLPQSRQRVLVFSTSSRISLIALFVSIHGPWRGEVACSFMSKSKFQTAVVIRSTSSFKYSMRRDSHEGSCLGTDFDVHWVYLLNRGWCFSKVESMVKKVVFLRAWLDTKTWVKSIGVWSKEFWTVNVETLSSWIVDAGAWSEEPWVVSVGAWSWESCTMGVGTWSGWIVDVEAWSGWIVDVKAWSG